MDLLNQLEGGNLVIVLVAIILAGAILIYYTVKTLLHHLVVLFRGYPPGYREDGACDHPDNLTGECLVNTKTGEYCTTRGECQRVIQVNNDGKS